MNIAIIGNGISGVTAARWSRKLGNHNITIISSESKYFFSRTALMYVYMGHLRFKDTKPYEDWFWKKNRINLIQDRVTSIDFNAKYLNLENDSSPLAYDKLILALGSSPNKFGWPGQDLIGVQGLYSLQNLEYIEEQTKNIRNAVIVGGGLIGIELAEMLHSRGIHVTFLVREKSYWDIVLPPEESAIINLEIQRNGIDLRLETELSEIISDENGHCRAVKTNTGETIEAQFVGLTAGVHPNVNFLRNTRLQIDKGI